MSFSIIGDVLILFVVNGPTSQSPAAEWVDIIKAKGEKVFFFYQKWAGSYSTEDFVPDISSLCFRLYI